jgi:hypothetical protein
MKIIDFFNEIADLTDIKYRIHLAKVVDGNIPGNIIARSKEEWKDWQKEKKVRERFPSPVEYIFSFGQINNESKEYVFGGIFKIEERQKEEYIVSYCEKYEELIGRVILTYSGENSRGSIFKPSYIIENSRITELLKNSYKGEKFPGIEKLNCSYKELKLVYDNNLEDWKSILSSIKGIYLLTDKKTGKHYIGSANGEKGIYGRWSEYIYGFDGGNKELIILKKIEGENYFKENFKFTILETMGMSISSEKIEERESMWKAKILTREWGYNLN